MKHRNNISGGILLILLGAFFLVTRLFPNLFERLFGSVFDWPWIIIGLGLVFIISAVLSLEGSLLIPGCVLTGIGLILNYQNASGNWESWSYAWALIPGFVGVGVLLSGLFSKQKGEWKSGVNLILISGILFMVFAGMFGALDGEIAKYWPVLIIALGVWSLIKGFLPTQKDH